MSMVGEQFDEFSNEVNGVVLQRRARNDRLAIWVADTNNLNSVQSIGWVLSWKPCLLNTELSFFLVLWYAQFTDHRLLSVIAFQLHFISTYEYTIRTCSELAHLLHCVERFMLPLLFLIIFRLKFKNTLGLPSNVNIHYEVKLMANAYI